MCDLTQFYLKYHFQLQTTVDELTEELKNTQTALEEAETECAHLKVQGKHVKSVGRGSCL